jgi:hypothetical protein
MFPAVVVASFLGSTDATVPRRTYFVVYVNPVGVPAVVTIAVPSVFVNVNAEMAPALPVTADTV